MTEYYIRRLLNGSYNVTKFDGGEAPSAVYNLTKKTGAKHWTCSCPAYNRMRGFNCKHGRMVEEFVSSGEPVPNVFKETV